MFLKAEGCVQVQCSNLAAPIFSCDQLFVCGFVLVISTFLFIQLLSVYCHTLHSIFYEYDCSLNSNLTYIISGWG